MLTAVTRNLAHRITGEGWLRAELAGGDSPDVVFVQEILPSLMRSPVAGYRMVVGRAAPKSAVGRTSAVLVREDLGDVVEGFYEDAGRPFEALGTYAAAARLAYGDRQIWLVSVHTSPSLIPPQKRRLDLETRSCESQPWWTDAFLADLRAFVRRGELHCVIAGDLNQARAYDRPPHVCSGEMLDAIAETGFIDVTSRDWNDIERATRLDPACQLDRVLASPDLASDVAVDLAEMEFDGASDHAPVRFTMDI